MVRYENIPLEEVSQGSYLLIDTAVRHMDAALRDPGGGCEMIYEWAEICSPSMTSFTFLLPVQPCQYTLIYNSLREREGGREGGRDRERERGARMHRF